MYISLNKEDLVKRAIDIRNHYDRFEYNLFRLSEELDKFLLPIVKMPPATIGFDADSMFISGGSIYRNLKLLDNDKSVDFPFIAEKDETEATLKEKSLTSDIDVYFGSEDQFKIFHTCVGFGRNIRTTKNSVSVLTKEEGITSCGLSAVERTYKTYKYGQHAEQKQDELSKNKKKYYCFDLVKKFGTQKQVLDSFDLSCCQISYSLGRFFFVDSYPENFQSNTWKVNNDSVSNYFKTFKRLLKYSRRGVKFTNDSLDTFYLGMLQKREDFDEAKKQYSDSNPDGDSGY